MEGQWRQACQRIVHKTEGNGSDDAHRQNPEHTFFCLFRSQLSCREGALRRALKRRFDHAARMANDCQVPMRTGMKMGVAVGGNMWRRVKMWLRALNGSSCRHGERSQCGRRTVTEPFSCTAKRTLR